MRYIFHAIHEKEEKGIAEEKQKQLKEVKRRKRETEQHKAKKDEQQSSKKKQVAAKSTETTVESTSGDGEAMIPVARGRRTCTLFNDSKACGRVLSRQNGDS